jgi:exopolysaccharide biosynthesis polyprenyl glycosylphosphotransferase
VTAAALPALVPVAADTATESGTRGSPFLRGLLIGVDAATLVAAWAISELLVGPAGRSILPTLAVVVLLPGTGVFLFGALGLYRGRVCSLRSMELTRMARACLLLSLVGLAGVALLGGLVTNAEVVLGAGLRLAFGAVTRSGYRNWLDGRRRDGHYLRPVVLIGCGEGSASVLSLLECHRELGYLPVGVVCDPEDAARHGQRWCGDLNDVVSSLAAAGATGAIVCTTALDGPTLNRVVHELLEARVHVQLSTGLRRVNIGRLLPQPLAHEPFFYVEPTSLARWQLVAKRALDLVVSTAVLLASAPVVALAALAIKLEDRGPVFFRQVRVGRDGQPFVLYKLRTMRMGAETQLDGLRDRNVRDGPLLKIQNDPRVRPLGRILRATSIDELPQLWNVLNGTMSLVGPRPALPDEVAQFDDELRAREAVRPGITGLWQVEGRDNPSFQAYRRFDLFYIENWSVGLDVMILFQTVESLAARLLRAFGRAGEDIHVARPASHGRAPYLARVPAPAPAVDRHHGRVRRHGRPARVLERV